jgi:probable F420-dependent oxidoreductase
MFDHVAGAVREGRSFPMLGPYSDRDPFHDPLVSFGYLAGVTKRIGLATGILVLPQRQTVLVARQAADIDLLSDGRLRLGVGAGWNPVEFEALGEEFHTRGKRMDEQIGLLRQLWRKRPLTFNGSFHQIDRAGLNPLPGRDIPIWVGGATEPAFRRAARLADGFIFSGSFEERILPAWERVQAHLVEQERVPGAFGAEYLLSEAVSATEVPAVFSRWEDAGGTHAAVRTMGHGFTEVAQHIDYLAEVRSRLA